MKHAPKLIVAVALLVLALGVAACGGDEDSNTSTASGANPSASSDSTAGSSQSSGPEDRQGGSGGEEQNMAASDGDGREVDASSGRNEGGKRTLADEKREASEFKPKKHQDSGGGSKQVRAPAGYDNSIQDFGSETTGSDLEEAAASLHNFYDARAEGNWAATCLYMSASQIKSITALPGDKGISCPEAVESLTGGLPRAPLREDAAAIDVASLRTEGDRGFLIYRGLEDTVFAISMVEEDGHWKVAAYSGVPIN